MEINLEICSTEHDKEGNEPYVISNAMTSGVKVHVGDGVSGNMVNGGDRVHEGDGLSGNMVDCGNEVHDGNEMSRDMVDGGDGVRENLVDAVGEVLGGDGVSMNMLDGENEVHIGDGASGNMVDGGDEVIIMVDAGNETHAGDGGSGNMVNGGDEGDMNPLPIDTVEVEGDTVLEPRIGMEFESSEQAYSIYQKYAKSMGFTATTKSSHLSSSSRIFANFACSKYGRNRGSGRGINRRACVKTGCKARMLVKRRQDEKWVVHSFIKEHNHELLPDLAYCFLGRRNEDLVGENNVDTLHDVSAQKKMDGAMSEHSGGFPNIGWLRNIKDQFDKGQNCVLDAEDAQIILNHFIHLQNGNSNFFYAVDLNEEERLRNVFWVDAKSRHDYVNFCDVVCFDTTYVRNKYKMPFVPFIGVNHHFQFVLLGCALIADEKTSTFVWLMKAWLRAMGGQAPQVIVADQDQAVKAAIAEVFPDVHHCYGLWHILEKIPENLGHVTEHNENFMTKFRKCIFRSWTDEQFEKRWWKIVENFQLKEDEWIQSLYEDRKQWVPTYMSDTFFAGMSTSQRSKSIISFFDKYVQEKTTLKEFVEQYETILQDRYEEEAKADFDTWHKQPALKSLSPYEKQLLKVYTHAIFKKFQAEVLGAAACHPKIEKNDGITNTFRVHDFEEHEDFLVAWKETKSEVSCSCRSFEYKGFLCRHAMLVLHISGVPNIPSYYILKRWMKDAKSRHTMRQGSEQLQSRVQRFNHLCQQAIRLGEEGSLSQERFHFAFRALEEALKRCVSVNNTIKSVSEPSTSGTHGLNDIEAENRGKNTTKTTKKKNTNKKRKVQSEQEVIAPGTQDSLQQMGHFNSSAPTLDGSFATQQSGQGMEQISPRALTLDGYYGTQQSVPGMVQLNLMGPSRDGYYGNQRSMQGLGPLNSTAPNHEGYYGTQQSMHGLGQDGF
ncbi:hypothetical protein HHK36_004665 [Tetracentron sinense]|uniref:Protein FAR1-RELATED SEQUENCE n=1 Tax=Tetracentron sinense TaxID=13715 RepID=A0A835DQE8_TETSI|nr:hypothetical protein HHK36_004665 [Tetracentron sinense]